MTQGSVPAPPPPPLLLPSSSLSHHHPRPQCRDSPFLYGCCNLFVSYSWWSCQVNMTDFAATVPTDVLLKEGMCDRAVSGTPPTKCCVSPFFARLLQSVCDATRPDCVEAGNAPEKWKVKLAALLGGIASACAILMSHMCLESTTCTYVRNLWRISMMCFQTKHRKGGAQNTSRKKRRFLATKTRAEEKKWKSTTSKWTNNKRRKHQESWTNSYISATGDN